MSRSNESEASETPDVDLIDLVRRLADRGFYVLGLLPSAPPKDAPPQEPA